MEAGRKIAAYSSSMKKQTTHFYNQLKPTGSEYLMLKELK